MRSIEPVTRSVRTGFDMILDPRVGILGGLEELARPAGAPDFIHYRARACATGAIGAQRNERIADAAAIDREEAAAKATAAAIARYCAALYDRDGLPLAAYEDAHFPCVDPAEFALHSEAQYRMPGFPWLPAAPDLPLRWAAVTDFASGSPSHVPAAFVFYPFGYFRDAGDLPLGQPTTTGLACRPGIAAAALAALAEVVAHDAIAIFWQAMIQPPRISHESLPGSVLALIHRFETTGDQVVLLDVTTDNRLPAFLAALASDRPERPAYVFAAASGLDPAETIVEALEQLASNAHLAQEIKAKLPPVSADNGWEDLIDRFDHLSFAADHANRHHFAFAFSSEDRRSFAGYENEATGDTESDLKLFLTRVLATDHRIYAANLTTEDVLPLGLNVCRVVVPGYQPLYRGHRLRALGGSRLYEVPRKLGYRGIARGQGGNPAPHPFF